MRLMNAIVTAVLVLTLFGAVRGDQAPSPGKNTIVDNVPPTDRIKVWHDADIQTMIKKSETARLLEGGDLYSLNLLHRTTEPATIHKVVADLYFIQEGTGTIETGGTIIDPKPSGRDGDQSGSGIKGGTKQLIKKGDIVFIPPGVVHHFLGGSDIWYLNVHFPGK